jgi:hypothetical protein
MTAVILPDGQITGKAVQPRLQKYSASRSGRNSSITRAVPPERGAYRDRHGRGAGCGGRGSVGRAWDRRAGFSETCERCDGAQDERCIRVRRSRVVLASVADAKSAEARRPDRAWTSLIRGRRWQKEFVTGESAKETVKTIACGNAGCFRCTCGDFLVCFHHSHARLRVHRHPAFPTPSMGGSSCHASGTSRRGNADAYPSCRRHSGAREA